MKKKHTKKRYIKSLRRLLCFGLILTLILSPSFSVFATDETSEEQSYEESLVNEASPPEAPPVQPSVSPESAEPKSAEPASEESAKTPVEETPEAAPQQSADADNGTECAETAVPPEETASPEQAADDSNTASVKAPAVTAPSPEINIKNAAESASSGPIHIGDSSFSSEDDESSHWSDGKGWKNVAGKYIAMVDYDGSEAEVSADGGVVSLAVAGVNKIGKLTGNCSYQISGTGIVLINSIEIEDGNTVTLHPDSALYKEGSAAVFLKQEDGSYMLINGGITGILDEVYKLDNINLVLPKDSSLTISVAGVRTETWDDEDGIKEDVAFYLTDMPNNADDPVHENGRVEIAEYVGNVVLGKNSTLTISEGASLHMKKISTGIKSIEAELIVQGVLNVLGIVEGGFIDVKSSGSVTGNGTIQSAEVDMDPEGYISSDLLLDKSGLTIKGDGTFTPPTLKDSIIYLKGSDITISELNASGVSRIGVNTNNGPSYTNKYKIGDITISSEGSLEIVCNDHPYGDDLYSRLFEDSELEINGNITGGPVHVLGGGVRYTGDQSDILPAVPLGYASRAFIDGIAAGSSLYPLNMTAEKAAELAESDKIPFSRLTVLDSLISEDILGRAWIVSDINILDPIDRVKDQEFTCASFLEHCKMTGESNPQMYFTAMEVIHSDMKRDRFYLGDEAKFDLNDAITVRVLDCIGRGGQGGSAATHTNASFTGNGVIGGTGSGSVQTGKGSVVFGKTSYTEPDPTPTPKPDDSTNTDNNKTTPSDNKDNNNNKTTPSDNKDSNNNKTTPSDNKDNNNNKTTPSDNKDNNNNKTAPSDNKGKDNNNNNNAVPFDNNGDNSITKLFGNNRNNSKTVKTNNGKAYVSSVITNGLIVTVWLAAPDTEEQYKADPDLPHIWHLDVTYAGSPVTDLRGNPVKAVFPFTVPESWGDPEEIASDSLYAVFADENENLTAYSAQYDPETGEMTFESELTGDLVIVQFAYEDEPFTEDFYRALADVKEIKSFLAYLKDKRS